MSEIIRKRLYVGGLSNSVSEDEISTRFSRFGNVSNLSLKSRHDDEGNCIKVFAHLDIEGSEENIKKCFNTYQSTKWKGSILKLQYAKESFLTRLEKERESELDTTEETSNNDEKKTFGEWKSPEFLKLDGPAVPGTPVPGKKDWVVGKYGRVLPVLNVKKSYKVKAIKHDPSKFCHSARVFKDENTQEGTSTELTWEINQPDSDITKKRKGEFPPSPQNKKPKKLNTMEVLKSLTTDKPTLFGRSNAWRNDDFEVVKIGQSNVVRESAPSRFDSDYEEDNEEQDTASTPLRNSKNSMPEKPLHKNSNDNSQKRQVKSINPKVHESTEKSFAISTPTNTRVPKDVKCSQLTADGSGEFASKSLSDSRKKISEFKGLGMLLGCTLSKISPKAAEKKLASSVLTKSKSQQKEDGLSSSRGNISIDDSLLLSDSSDRATKESVCEPSSNEKRTRKKMLDVKRSKNKKAKKNLNSEDSSSSEEISFDVITATDSVKSIPKADGYESASSANTDEIIAQRRGQGKSDIPSNEMTNTLYRKNYLLSQSMDLSEFSASAPEIASNSIGISSPVTSAISPHSFNCDLESDSDLDSNDFELVAKKLAQKAINSQSKLTNKRQKSNTKAETLISAKNLPESSKMSTDILKESPKKIADSLPESPKKSTKQSVLIKRKETLDNNTEKIGNVNLKESLSSEKSSLEKKLLEIASSNDKPSDKKSRQEKLLRNKQNKHALDNEKRLQALDEQKKLKEQQKKIMKTALENVDSACTRRIVFDSSDEDEGSKPTLPRVEKLTTETERKEASKKSSPKLKLLDSSSSDESDYEEMFKSKPQFEGKKGEKLMAMQRKIGDSRFQLDEKFMDSEESDEEEDEKGEKDQENSLTDEKKMSLEVLENVIGKSKLDQFNAKLKKKTKHMIDMNAVRFDPTKVKTQCQEPILKEESSESEEEDEMETDLPSSKTPEKVTKSEKQITEDESKKKSTVTMASSLVDMLKSQAKAKEQTAVESTSSFSLLQQFDQDGQDEESSEEEEEDTTGKDLSTGMPSPKKFVEPMETDEDESSDEKSEEEDDADGSDSESESDSEEEASEEKITQPDKEEVTQLSKKKMAQQNEPTKFVTKDTSSSEGEDEEQDTLTSIMTPHNHEEEKEKALLNAGRTDIRFTKENWLERWDEIRTDLMKLCRRKHKDAGKRKRVMNEKKRKKDILKNVNRKPWLKR